MASAIEIRKYDAIVIGGGGAGLRAALQLSDSGLSVAVLSKVFPTRSHTVAAQGGIAAVTSTDDTIAEHVADTVAAGAGLCFEPAVQVLCQQGPQSQS